MQLVWPLTRARAELTAGTAHVWAVPLNCPEASAEVRSDLSAEERSRADRYRFDDPRRQFVNSRLALRGLLASYLGVAAADVEITTDVNGKPRLHGASESAGLKFNLAHSGNLALVAVTRGCEVGVDIEQIRTVSHMEQIARRYFHHTEIEEIFALAAAAREEAFLRCWTAKEAVLKAIGTGLAGSLATFRVPVIADNSAWVNVPAAASADTVTCWVQQLAPCDGYLGAVALVGKRIGIERYTFQW